MSRLEAILGTPAFRHPIGVEVSVLRDEQNGGNVTVFVMRVGWPDQLCAGGVRRLRPRLYPRPTIRRRRS